MSRGGAVSWRLRLGISTVAQYRLVKRRLMKGKHPEQATTSVRCSTCGSEFRTRSTLSDLVVDVCSNCHPAYTGVARAVARGSRIERFERRRALGARR
jgi:large subunit ribosomal protein L31